MGLTIGPATEAKLLATSEIPENLGPATLKIPSLLMGKTGDFEGSCLYKERLGTISAAAALALAS